MKVLVAYASRHGSTRGIAERIARTLQRPDIEVIVREITFDQKVEPFDAYVIGSAAYLRSWLGQATDFVRANTRVLARTPVWLFSSGPVGVDKVDKQGRDVLATSIPKEFSGFLTTIYPRDARVFFGAWDPDAKPAGIADRFVRGFTGLFPSMKASMPFGDFRDWPAIEAWAETIAQQLLIERVPTPA